MWYGVTGGDVGYPVSKVQALGAALSSVEPNWESWGGREEQICGRYPGWRWAWEPRDGHLESIRAVCPNL